MLTKTSFICFSLVAALTTGTAGLTSHLTQDPEPTYVTQKDRFESAITWMPELRQKNIRKVFTEIQDINFRMLKQADAVGKLSKVPIKIQKQAKSFQVEAEKAMILCFTIEVHLEQMQQSWSLAANVSSENPTLDQNKTMQKLHSEIYNIVGFVKRDMKRQLSLAKTKLKEIREKSGKDSPSNGK